MIEDIDQGAGVVKLSAGLLLFRKSDDVLEVLIVHMGGPFWARKDAGGWSIPKGEYEEGEDPKGVAYREFEEELGSPPPSGDAIELGMIRQPSGKRITGYALRGDFDASRAVSNEFEMEWPKGSGKIQTFPEIDKAEWFDCQTAKTKLLKGQVGFVDRLTAILRDGGETFKEVRQSDATLS